MANRPTTMALDCSRTPTRKKSGCKLLVQQFFSISPYCWKITPHKIGQNPAQKNHMSPISKPPSFHPNQISPLRPPSNFEKKPSTVLKPRSRPLATWKYSQCLMLRPCLGGAQRRRGSNQFPCGDFLSHGGTPKSSKSWWWPSHFGRPSEH